VDRPVTIPELSPTGATDGALLVHVPPGSMSVSKDVVPKHSVVIPDIGSGVGFTVNNAVAAQPVAVSA